MSDERVATVRPVSEAEASGTVAAVYEDIRRTKGIDFVPNFWARWRSIRCNWNWCGRRSSG